jgi:two-component system, OmpR family, response regulator QseB
MRERVLIVEDDPRLAEVLARELGRGYDTVVAHNGRDALFLAETGPFALVLLDLNLPDMDGLDVAEQLEGNPADVVMLTARADLASRVRGLYAGAADYISKPFQMEELLARVFARVRSRERARAESVQWGAVTLSPADRSCRVDGAWLELTAQEYHLLALLLEHQGRVFTKDTLIERLYGAADAGPNAVEAVVSRLRRKLAAAGAGTVVETVRGLGYLVRPAGA